jgi:glucosylceramidase
MTSIPAASRDGLRWAKPSFVRAIIPLALALLISACKKDDAKITGPSCPVDQMACGPICLDVTADPMNCGGCGIPCSTGQICQGGACQCVSGLVCNGACVPSDATHCGDCATSCPSGQVCSSNICSSACSVGQTPCGTACTDTNGDDVFNCGGCGMPCAPGKICSGGICLDVSATGATGSDGGMAGVDGGAGGTTGTTESTLVTSAPGAYWNTVGLLAEVTTGNADVTVNDASTAQIWEGFGGAFNEMGWNYLSMLSQSDRDNAIQLLYGADGARFVFGRIPIGASDYAMDRYTLDETANDTTLAGFSIDRDKQLLIPFVKAAQAVKANIRFWASPWTPPTWMKQGPPSPGKVVSAFDGGSMKDDDVTMTAYAQYLIKFVQAYGQQGIPIEAISAQNEPNYTGNYPTCAWSPSTYTKFIGQFLGPAVASASPATKIVLGTFNGGGSDRSIVSSVMGDTAAQSYVKLLGFQWGMVDTVGSAQSYHLPIWQSEHKCGNYPWATPFNATMAPNDQAYAVESWGLIRDWIKAGVTAYSAWNMVLDTVGVGIDTTRVWPQDALLTVDTQAKTLNITPAYYVFRHVSRFAATGARVVATSGGDALAFKNPDGGIVAVMYNSGSAKTMTVSMAGKRLQFAMPGNGWATVVSR